MSAFANLTAAEIVKKIRAKEFTAKAVTTAYLDRIKLLEPKIKAFNEVFNAQALRQAEAIDARLAKGEESGALAGVPVAIKDNLLIQGEHCTCSSKILQGFKATYDATVIGKLRQAGAIFVEGEVNGNLTANDRIELKNSARYNGDLQSSKLVVDEGAVFRGHVTVGPDAVKGNGQTRPAVSVATNPAMNRPTPAAVPQAQPVK